MPRTYGPAPRLPRPKAGTQRLEVSCDFLNLGNLPHRDGGLQSVGPNSNNAGYALLDCVRRDAAANQPGFQFRNPSSTPWQTDPINSRGQGQVGVRYSFD